MGKFDSLINRLKENPRNVQFADLVKVCTYFFGSPMIRGSHHYFTVPWPGEPLVNIQNDGGKAKTYQVKQVLAAIEVLKGMSDV